MRRKRQVYQSLGRMVLSFDSKMTGGDGLETIRQVSSGRKMEPQTRVVF
jgi:hypothetical protein